SLDFEPRQRCNPRNEAASKQPQSRVTGADPQRPALDASTLPPEVVQAQSAHVLRNYPLVVELLEPRLHECPELPGGQRTLGFALARLNREEEARVRLREAARQSPADWAARTALASLLLRVNTDLDAPLLPPDASSSPTAEAVTHLEAAVTQSP